MQSALVILTALNGSCVLQVLAGRQRKDFRLTQTSRTGNKPISLQPLWHSAHIVSQWETLRLGRAIEDTIETQREVVQAEERLYLSLTLGTGINNWDTNSKYSSYYPLSLILGDGGRYRDVHEVLKAWNTSLQV